MAVNGGTARDERCTAGEGTSSVRLNNFTGTASLSLAAADMNGFVYFRKQTSAQVVPSASTPVTVTLDWDVGSLPVKWQLKDGTQTLTCAQAGVTSVFLNLRTAQGTFLYADAGAEVPCADAMTGQGTVFPYLPQGSFEAFFQAVGTGGKLYKTNQMTPPRVTVRAGQFPVLDASTTTFVLEP